MKVYRMKHLPTDLYYTPSRGSGNLSKKGKLYVKKPDIGWGSTLRIVIRKKIENIRGHHKIIVNYFGLSWSGHGCDEYVHTLPEHWEIEEVN